jgi:hypothetical protein
MGCLNLQNLGYCFFIFGTYVWHHYYFLIFDLFIWLALGELPVEAQFMEF